MRIAIISDIHSNIYALESTFKKIDDLNRAHQIDKIICLGDILNYGCNPNQVIESLMSYNTNYDMEFLIGNHDQLHFDLKNGSSEYFNKLPDYLKESIEWTIKELNYDLEATFNWKTYTSLNKLFFSHANPFDFPDWSYLSGDEIIHKAAIKLSSIGCIAGIFGHIHRSYELRNIYKEVSIFNVGSVGQPRGLGSTFGVIDSFINAELKFELININYQTKRHTSEILESSLSPQTAEKLLDFFKDD